MKKSIKLKSGAGIRKKKRPGIKFRTFCATVFIAKSREWHVTITENVKLIRAQIGKLQKLLERVDTYYFIKDTTILAGSPKRTYVTKSHIVKKFSL